jgi:2-succinyl-6-hydroxy-2,4-cyclohexadiene-1-carboxylate synthase
MNLHFVHGFFGLSSDWHPFKDKFYPHKCIFHSIEKYEEMNSQIQNNSFENWAINFNKINLKNTGNILIGYSLGGRLALHSILENQNWDAAIIISANPGLTDDQQKDERKIVDSNWSKRILCDSWKTLMSDWNAQTTFQNFNPHTSILRNEKDYDRKSLAQMIIKYSISRQENLRPKLTKTKIPILWIAGERDLKYKAIAEEMKKINPQILDCIIKNASHRAPWDNPTEFIIKLKEFIRQLKMD